MNLHYRTADGKLKKSDAKEEQAYTREHKKIEAAKAKRNAPRKLK